MIKMMVAMGAASVMTTVVLAGSASLSMYGMRAVLSSSANNNRIRREKETLPDQREDGKKGETS